MRNERIIRYLLILAILSLPGIGFAVFGLSSAWANPLPNGIVSAAENGSIYLEPPEQSLTGERGETLTFVERLGNLTGVTDTITLTLGASIWPAAISDNTVGPLLNGQEITFTVSVTIPLDAELTFTDTLIVNATSSISPTIYFDTAVLNAKTPAFSPYTYLPMVIKPAPVVPGLRGMVTMNGAPASSVPLDLRFYDGSNWSTLFSTTTGADGSYSFMGVPTLASGQSYYVRFVNDSDDSRLFAWYSRILDTYDSNTEVIFDPFDIADVVLSDPQPGATVNLPYTFFWVQRPATPTDSYEFDLFDPDDDDPWFYTVPPLGYVGSYALNGLPSGFSTGVEYGWTIWVYAPDGGYGIAYYYYTVTFD